MGNLLGSPITEKETHTGWTPDGMLHSNNNSKAQYTGRNFCGVLSRNYHFVQYAHHIQTDTTTMTESDKEQHQTEGLAYLEESLTATFVELDREIYQHVYGDTSTIQNLNQIYGADYQHDEVTQWQTIVQHHTAADITEHQHQHPSLPYAQNDPKIVEREDSGTTAVVVIVSPDWIVCANAGDSRAVYSKYGYKAVALSYNHKPDDEAEERSVRELIQV